ncbi:hypothetical protein JCM11491_003643 [Sporobolomyces phaffii]
MRFITTALTLASLARASVTPTSPGTGEEVYVAGQECSFEWTVDETREWKSFDVDLLTGHNFHVTNLTRVAAGVDGTDPLATKFSFRCPEVDPPAPIYFYQFSQGGEDPAWTRRFTIAAANGTTVDAPNTVQPNRDEIPWGTGHLVNASVQPAEAIHSLTSPDSRESIVSIVGEMFGQDTKDVLFDETTSATGPTETAATGAVSPPSIQTTSPAVAGQWSPTPTANEWKHPEHTAVPSPHPTNSSTITGFHRGRVCSNDAQCPGEAPCCSEYGFCGTGRNCLAGCNPLASFEPRACAPVPACLDQDYSFQPGSIDRALQNSSTWNGDATLLDWVVDNAGNPTSELLTTNSTTGESALTLSLDAYVTNGTVVTSTRSLLYGNVTARIRSGSAVGVVTGFTLISAIGDEINFEFTHNVTDSLRTSVRAGLEPDASGGEAPGNATLRLDDSHDYTVSWLPEAITLLVDGAIVRTVAKESTLGDPAYSYPQTPSRIRFWIRKDASLEPASETPPTEFAGRFFGTVPIVEPVSKSVLSYVSAVNVLCYPVELLSNFTFDNTSHTFQHDNSSSNATLVPNSALDAIGSSIALNSILPLARPSDSSSTVYHGFAISSSTPQPSGQTPPLASSSPGLTPLATTSQSPEQAAISAPAVEPVPAWNVTPLRRLRRLIALDRVKRDNSALSAYSYGAVDDHGRVAVNGYSGSTLIASDYATGTNSERGLPFRIVERYGAHSHDFPSVLAVDSAADHSGGTHLGPSNAGPAADKDAGDSGKAGGKSRIQRWNDLPLWAHVLIIGGAALVGLLLVVIIGRCFWQAYKPIGDPGDFHDKSTVTPYVSSNGMGYDPAPVGSGAGGLHRSASASTAQTYTHGGYIPSSSLRKQYFPNRSSTEDRV